MNNEKLSAVLGLKKQPSSGTIVRGSVGRGVLRNGDVLSVSEGMVPYHSYSQEEKKSFCEYLNQLLKNDPDLQDSLPMNSDNLDLFEVVSKGVLLCKLINRVTANTIPEKKLVVRPKRIFDIIENHNLCIKGAKQLGCKFINMSPQDFMEKQSHLILSILWQILRILLLSDISITAHPEMASYFETSDLKQSIEGEDAHFENLPPEQNLLRWANNLLSRSSSGRVIKNLNEDLKDSVCYLHILNQISPTVCDLEGLKESSLLNRAKHVIKDARKIGCDHHWVDETNIVQGNLNLNLAFVATLFHKHCELEIKQAKIDNEKKQEELRRLEIEKNKQLEQENKRLKEEQDRLEKERLESERKQKEQELAEKERLEREKKALEEQQRNAAKTAEEIEQEEEARYLQLEAERIQAEKDLEEREKKMLEAAERKRKEDLQKIREEELRLEQIREEEKRKYLALRKAEEEEKKSAIKETLKYEESVKKEDDEKVQAKEKEKKEKTDKKLKLKAERKKFPVVLFVTSEPEQLQAAEDHLTTQGRNTVYVEENKEAVELIKATKCEHVVIVGLFSEKHDSLLDLASTITEKFPKTKLICCDSIVRKDVKLQQRCKSFGIDCARRGFSLWKLLGVRPAPLISKTAGESVLSFD